jgi:transposase InsO family protein
MVVTDRCSRRIRLVPCHTTDTATETAMLFLRHIVSQHEYPNVIISDYDPRFISDFWKASHENLGTRLAMSTANHPQREGLAERRIKTMEEALHVARLLRLQLDCRERWCTASPRVASASLPLRICLQLEQSRYKGADPLRSGLRPSTGCLPLSGCDKSSCSAEVNQSRTEDVDSTPQVCTRHRHAEHRACA